ncbi:MAG TPA: LamG domain-containing protein [archaeon]|nr:LamG domain-containing protein [archaeon]
MRELLILTVLVMLSSFVQAADITTGLVGYWKFDENSGTVASDSSGNNNYGEFRNNTAWAGGFIGSATSFDGDNDYVDVNESNFDFERTNAFSVSAWINPSEIKNAQIVSKLRNGVTYDGWEVQLTAANEIVFWVISDFGASNYIQQDCNVTVPTGEWSHVVFTYDGSSSINGFQCYFNGADANNHSPSGPSTVSGSILNDLNVQIGQRHTSTTESWNGLLDEIRVYRRELSAKDANELYNCQTNNYCPRPDIVSNLVGYWRFDEGTGTIVADSSGNDNNGTLINSPVWANGYTNSDLNFSKITDTHVDLGNPSDLNITGPLSISAWGYTNSAPNNALSQEIFTREGGVTDRGYRFHFEQGTPSDLRFSLGITPTTNTILSSSTQPDANKWYHFVATYDPSTAMKIYINGVQTGVDSTDIPSSISASSAGPDIGVRDGGGENWDGGLDEIRVYNRVLNTADINTLYYCQPPTVVARDWLIDGNTNCEFGLTTPSIDANLNGYWPFDEGNGTTTVDRSGNGNTGTLVGTPNWTTGKIVNALNFRGPDTNTDHVTLSNSSLLSPGTGNFTVAAWFKAEPGGAIPGLSSPPIYNDYGTSNTARVSINIENVTGKIVASWRDDSSNEIEFFGSPGSVEDSTWHHVAIVRDLQTRARLYFDGVDTNSQSNASMGAITTSTGSVPSIGDLNSGVAQDQFFKGQIDEVRVYSRALSATDVNNLYKETKSIVLGGNLNIQDGTLLIKPGYFLTIPTAKKALIWRRQNNTDQKLMVAKTGGFRIRK